MNNNEKEKKSEKLFIRKDLDQIKAKKLAYLDDKKTKNAKIDELKLNLKRLKSEHSQNIKNLSTNKQDANYHELKTNLIDSYNDQVIDYRNQILEIKYNFGLTHKRFSWNILKWIYGIRKEFNRVIWSHPSNTFKYLAIIIIIILVLALLFFVIDMVISKF